MSTFGLLKLLLATGFSLGLLNIVFRMYSFPLKQPLAANNDTQVFIPCSYEKEYPHTYYRRSFEYEKDSFSVFAVDIGEIIASNMKGPEEIDEWSNIIHHDLLYLDEDVDYSKKHIQISTALHDVFFNRTGTSNQSDVNHTFSLCNEVDFFDFVHHDSPQTNDSTATGINFYNLLPIEANTKAPDYVSLSKHKYENLNDTYYLPSLYEYVLAVDLDGNLPSVQLRFAEISNAKQSDMVKHKLLNRNEKQVLWAGEFYIVYDYRYRNYVAIFDTASGHWKPKKKKTPRYLYNMLVQALFPRFKATPNRDFYQPLILVGYDEHPWGEWKRILFPLMEKISALRANRSYFRKLGLRKKEKQKKMAHFIEAQRIGSSSSSSGKRDSSV